MRFYKIPCSATVRVDGIGPFANLNINRDATAPQLPRQTALGAALNCNWLFFVVKTILYTSGACPPWSP